MNNINQLFKDRFENYEAPVSDGLWDKIEKNPIWQKHQHRQKNKNLAYYSAMAIVSIGTCGAILLHKPQTDTALLEQAPSEKVINETPSSASETADTQILIEQTTIVEENTAPVKEETNAKTDMETSPITENFSEQSSNNMVDNSVSSVTPTPNPITPAKTENHNEISYTKSETAPAQNPKSNNNTETRTSDSTPIAPPAPANNETLHSLFSIPNAFTPNGDGLNDIFKPVTAAEVHNYQLDIYMPNGQHVFSSKNIDFGWNGEYQGSLQNGGTFIYVIKYKDTTGKEHIDKGQLLLMR